MHTNSQIAHESIKPFLNGFHSKIYDALQKIEQGSFRDIAKACDLRDDQVWRRLSEMKNKNLIEDIGSKICPTSQMPVSVWRIKKEKLQ